MVLYTLIHLLNADYALMSKKRNRYDLLCVFERKCMISVFGEFDFCGLLDWLGKLQPYEC